MTFDHQPGYSVVEPLDRTASIADLRTVSNTPTHPLVSCVDDTGSDCLENLRSYDDAWSYKNEKGVYDRKNLKKYWILDFGDLSDATGSIELVLRGARDYAASAEYPGNSARSVQVKDANGNWVEIYNKNQLGSDGSPRLRTIDLTGKFQSNNYQVKVAFDTFNANYFAIDTSPQVPFTTHTYHPDSADLQYHGFTAIDHTYFMNHDYSKVSPFPDTLFKNQYGHFTKYGDVTPLLNASDDHFVVMRYGDQLSVEFPYVAPEAGMERSFILYNDVTYKHATNDNLGVLGQNADYLPYHGMTKYALDMTPYPMTPENTAYINEWNTRVYDGPYADALRTHSSTIIDSYSTADVYGSGDTGGLVGANEKEIRRSYATGRVQSDNGYAGGLAGSSYNSTAWIHDSYATGEVHGGYGAGGLIGYSQSQIERSYSTGDVYASYYGYANVGGFGGVMYPGYDGPYDSFTTSRVMAGDVAGGFVGYGYGFDYYASNNWWFNDLSEGSGYGFGAPAQKAESADVFMLSTTTSPLNTWDFDSIWAVTAGVNNNYPYLRWQQIVPAPVISDISTSVGNTSATITWTTDATSSTKVLYSLVDGSYVSSTETDTGARVTEHTKTISDLLPCTTYFFKVYSSGAYNNHSTSNAAIFTTTGCSAGASPDEKVTGSVSSTSTATTTLNVTEGSKYFSVTTPENFTGTSTSIVIQIKSLDKNTVLGSIGKPNGLTGVGGIVFDVKALINATTTLDSFDVPVTITYHYNDADIAGLDESTLVLYHYHDGVWSQLDSCSVNAAENSITCTTPNFSIFSLFGSAPASAATTISAGPTGSGGSVHYGCKDPQAQNYEEFAASDASLCIYGKIKVATSAELLNTPVTTAVSSSTTTTGFIFTRDLKMGMKGNDVKELQKILVSKHIGVAADKLAKNGVSTYFGALTKAAVIEYQKAKGIKPVTGTVGSKTRAMLRLK